MTENIRPLRRPHTGLSPKPVTPPEHLSPESGEWYTLIASSFVLEAHHMKLLQHAAESWDRKEAARKQLDAEGLTFLTRFGEPRVHPAVAVARDAGRAFVVAVRELDLDGEPTPGTRPPRGRS